MIIYKKLRILSWGGTSSMDWPSIVSAIASVIALVISGFALFQTHQNREQTKELFEEARKPYVIAYIQSQ